jgi:hypothetical protein
MAIKNLVTSKIGDKSEGALDQVCLFSLQGFGQIWKPELLDYVDLLEKLVFQIARKPKHLLMHVQRIYYCFHANLNEQLFAAVIDLFIVLDKRGQAISWRILMGVKDRLDSMQFSTLKGYLKNNRANADLLPGNQYSIFSRGLMGVTGLVAQSKAEAPESDHDPLALARDYIEFSQLEEAKRVLEQAILDDSTRLDMHHELLILYHSTNDIAGFKQMLAELTQSGADMTNEWEQLNNFFEGRDGNG